MKLNLSSIARQSQSTCGGLIPDRFRIKINIKLIGIIGIKFI